MRCPSWERRPTCDPLKTLLPTFGSYCKINIECVLPGTLGYSWCGVLAGIGCGGDGGCLTSFTPVTRAGVVELFISLLSSPTTTPDTDTHIELSESKKVFLSPLLPPSHQFNVDHENLQVVRWKLVSVEDNKNVWIEQHPQSRSIISDTSWHWQARAETKYEDGGLWLGQSNNYKLTQRTTGRSRSSGLFTIPKSTLTVLWIDSSHVGNAPVNHRIKSVSWICILIQDFTELPSLWTGTRENVRRREKLEASIRMAEWVPIDHVLHSKCI